MSKEERYDRQLRLWAASGQRSIENGRVLVVVPGVSCVELLKNIVLPGVGGFCVVDLLGATVREEDVADGFFYDLADVGRPRGEVLVRRLRELNPDVRGELKLVGSVEEFWRGLPERSEPCEGSEPTEGSELGGGTSSSPGELSGPGESGGPGEPCGLSRYHLVVMQHCYKPLVRRLFELNIPVIVVNSAGFFGALRIFKKHIELYDTHPNSLVDLRVFTPWHELRQYCDSIHLDQLSEAELSAVPYLVLQLKNIDAWKLAHGGRIPQNYTEKVQFKESFKTLSRFGSMGLVNFDEAVTNSNYLFNANNYTVPSNVQDLFRRLDDNTAGSTQFWLLVRALKKFVDTDEFHLLPISGELPDMDSDSASYLRLLQIYRDKFQRDFVRFKHILRDILQNHTHPLQTGRDIDDDTITSFLKNCKHLHYSSMELNLGIDWLKKLVSREVNMNSLLLMNFVLLDELQTTDEHVLLKHGSQLVDPSGAELNKKIVKEMARNGFREINTVGSIMGGIAGQEALKLLTNQYIPLENTLVFNGLRSTTERWKI